MKASAVQLMVVFLILNVLVYESSAHWEWGRKKWTRVKNWYRRVRLLKRGNAKQGQDTSLIPDDCDFGCFWFIHDQPDKADVAKAQRIFDRIDDDGNGFITQEEFDAYEPKDDKTENGGKSGGDDTAAKRELMEDLEEMLMKEKDKEEYK